MNLVSNNVSFEGKYQTRQNNRTTHRPRQVGYTHSKYASNPNRRYNEDGDSYEIKYKSITESRKDARAKKEARIKKDEKFKMAMAAFLAAMTVGGSAAGINALKESFEEPEAGFYTNNHTIEEVSKFTEIPSDIIAAANGLKAGEELPETIVMPTKYKEGNKDIADTYTDGKYVYIEPKYNVTMEAIKEEYGIKDGVIRNNNDNLTYTFASESTASGDCVSYKDYTKSSADKGTIVKVPLKDLNQTD